MVHYMWTEGQVGEAISLHIVVAMIVAPSGGTVLWLVSKFMRTVDCSLQLPDLLGPASKQTGQNRACDYL